MSTRFTDETISTARLISFSDGVFAIAVTLLVFNLKVPVIPKTNAHMILPGMIRDMLPHFATYVYTFLLIALYWTFNHRILNLVTHVDNTFIWMNICYLLMISFIPFPSALFGSYPDELFSFIFYICSMIMVSLLSMLMLGYASYDYRLVNKDLPIATVKYLFFRHFTSIIVFLTAIPLAFYHLRWAQYYLFILFPIHRFTKKYFRKYAGN
jgi:uncharacterized membrane protein